MKKAVKILCGLFLTLSLSVGILSPASMQNAEAAAGYKKIEPGSTSATPIGYPAYGNGKQAYYVRDFTLYKYTYASRKESKVKKLPSTGASNDPHMAFYVTGVYGDQIYLTKGSQGQWKNWTYSYNLKTKKLKKLLSNCSIKTSYGKYVVGQNAYRTDVSAYPITLYKIQSSGLKKIKKLTSHGWEPTFAGGKLYYAASPDNIMRKVTLYRCNLNGSGRKKIKTFSTSQKYGQVSIFNITSKSCEVYKDGNHYRYTYVTNKMKKI